jgi:predicted DNA-binding transcriptional regulator AlpA
MQSHIQAESRRASMPAQDDDALLNSAQTKARCGNVTDMCIWRWMRDPRVQFPQPLQINKRNYWRLGDLRRWQEEQAARSAKPREVA